MSENLHPTPLLRLRDLRTWFETNEGTVKAVDGVSLDLHRGEIFGLVGESGSGKSITGLSIMRLIEPPGRIAGGDIQFCESGDSSVDLATLPEADMRRLRGSRIAMVFQDPMMSLNPVLRIDTQMTEAVLAHSPGLGRHEALRMAREALVKVGITAPDERLQCYPHQLSGGMRQRVNIATAFINRPSLVIADEPTTALDVTIQAQAVYEARKLCREAGTAMIWVTHDLALVSGLADRLGVMYAGRLVEVGTVAQVIGRARHPYTRGLMGSVPSNNPRGRPLRQIRGMTPSLARLPEGCAFAPRCEHAQERCRREVPQPTVMEQGHVVRCHFPLEGRPGLGKDETLDVPQAQGQGVVHAA